jgi:hypothetical protein
VLLFLFSGCVVLIGAGAFALVYAGHHAAAEAADPQSSRWFHYGAIVLTVLGVLLLVVALIAAANFTR